MERKSKIRLWDKNKALENLGRHEKLFVDKFEEKRDYPTSIEVTYVHADRHGNPIHPENEKETGVKKDERMQSGKGVSPCKGTGYF